MLLNSELPSNERRESILSASPLLRTFLNRDFNDEQWAKEIESNFEPTKDEFNKFLGTDWQVATATPLLISLINLRVTNPSISNKALLGTLNTILGIGYQIQEIDNCKEFLTDICIRLRDIEALNYELLVDANLRERIVDVVMGLLATGVYIYQMSEADKSAEDDDSPSSFTDFINGLDI